MRRFSKRKQITRSTKVTYKGHKFASKLELYMYKALEREKIKVLYEGETYEVVKGFHFPASSYEKTKGKKILQEKGNKNILPIRYTPDFIDFKKPRRFIIECKGNPNEAFPIRWKLFKKHLVDTGQNPVLFMPRNQKDCEVVVDLLKKIL
mgnify:FL=1